MEDNTLMCYGILALLIIIPTTVIWLLNRRSGASLVNIVPMKIKQFERKNPDLHVIKAGVTKARKMKRDRKPRYGLGWKLSRRSVLILSEEGLHCGNWFLPLYTISEAALIKTPGEDILKVNTIDDHYYQFGLRINSKWEEQFPLPIVVERSDLVLTFSSIAFRLPIVGYFLWVIIRDFSEQRFSVFTVIEIVLVVYFSMPIIRIIQSKTERSK